MKFDGIKSESSIRFLWKDKSKKVKKKTISLLTFLLLWFSNKLLINSQQIIYISIVGFLKLKQRYFLIVTTGFFLLMQEIFHKSLSLIDQEMKKTYF